MHLLRGLSRIPRRNPRFRRDAKRSKPLFSVEGVWAHVKRSLANLAVAALDRLEAGNRLKRLRCRPVTLDGFITGTGLALDDPASP
ncbi:hypothetical protein GCM10010294_69310 [Streptomyces griseoloalbus]|nr:hypothetical protein GCM10010294_69310 [Streptomyces griseoloalbus]